MECGNVNHGCVSISESIADGFAFGSTSIPASTWTNGFEFQGFNVKGTLGT